MVYSKNLKNLIDEYVRINPVITAPEIPTTDEDQGNTLGNLASFG